MAKLTKEYQCSLQLLDALVGGKFLFAQWHKTIF